MVLPIRWKLYVLFRACMYPGGWPMIISLRCVISVVFHLRSFSVKLEEEKFPSLCLAVPIIQSMIIQLLLSIELKSFVVLVLLFGERTRLMVLSIWSPSILRIHRETRFAYWFRIMVLSWVIMSTEDKFLMIATIGSGFVIRSMRKALLILVCPLGMMVTCEKPDFVSIRN